MEVTLDKKWRFKKAALKEARGKFSETQMGKYLYRSSGYIKNIESGKFKPSMDTLMDICRITGKPPKFFFEEVR
jgi:transcriptional regulator with XRE-family HTH domain